VLLIPNLRRARRLAAVASAVLLASTPAQAADNLDAGATYLHGSVLTLGVSGAPLRDGAIAVRFANSSLPLFWGNTGMTDMNDQSATALGIHVGGTTYAAVNSTYASTEFTQTAPPSVSGTGTVADPWIVVNHFRAGADLPITQTVEHVNGTGRYSVQWEITNTAVTTANLRVYYGGDTEIPYLPQNTSELTGAAPNRVLSNVSPDGARVELHERTQWTHYFAGQNGQFGLSTRNNMAYDYNDVVTATPTDAGLAAQWNVAIAPAATETVAVDVDIVAPPLPTVPPTLTGTLPTEGAFTTVTSAAPAFAKGSGDTVSTTLECRFDAAAWAACTSPLSYPTLSDGEHSFSVRGVNSANIGGVAATRTWTVDTTTPDAPVLAGKPDAVSKSAGAAFTITGEKGAAFTCSLDGGESAPCTSPYTLSGLADGAHTVAVKQTDRAGHTSAAAGYTWTVDTTVTPAPPAPPVQDKPCTSKRVVAFSFKVPARVKPKAFVVTVDGKRVAKLKPTARKTRVSLVGLPAGSVKVRVKTTGKHAKVLTTRTYRTCTAGR
jgi:hypothetical protein